MFDRYIVHRGPSDVHVHHTEHRAPTDESVRLLRDMEAAARSSVVEAMRLKCNTIEAIVHRHDGCMDLRTVFFIHYNLNGQHREVKYGCESHCTITEQLDGLWKALAEDIASYLLESHAREVIR